jgi:hypothetical protein
MITEPKQQVSPEGPADAFVMLFVAGIALCFIVPPLGFFLLFLCLLAVVIILYVIIAESLKSLFCKPAPKSKRRTPAPDPLSWGRQLFRFFTIIILGMIALVLGLFFSA